MLFVCTCESVKGYLPRSLHFQVYYSFSTISRILKFSLLTVTDLDEEDMPYLTIVVLFVILSFAEHNRATYTKKSRELAG